MPIHFRKMKYNETLFRCTCQVLDVFKRRYGEELDLNATAFNAGFFIANLQLLRLNDKWLKSELHFWMNVVRMLKRNQICTKWKLVQRDNRPVFIISASCLLFQNLRLNSWYPGTQTLMLLAFYKKIQLLDIDPDIYADGLGSLKENLIKPGSKPLIYHWNGHSKLHGRMCSCNSWSANV